jgi:hypothetical protein
VFPLWLPLMFSLSFLLLYFFCFCFFLYLDPRLSLSLSLSLSLVGFCTLSSQDNDKVWDFVFWLDWDTNSPASAGLLVAVSSACWHLVAVEESRLERGQMVDHSVYVQVWSEGSETWPEVMVFAGGLSSVSDEEEDAQCFWNGVVLGSEWPSFSLVTEVLTFCNQALYFIN